MAISFLLSSAKEYTHKPNLVQSFPQGWSYNGSGESLAQLKETLVAVKFPLSFVFSVAVYIQLPYKSVYKYLKKKKMSVKIVDQSWSNRNSHQKLQQIQKKCFLY
ncbi:hypothetical protein TorRG33x02_041830 [Trema orientale]|uniref:Uncharacterized protein n=1 Tax=Trema orientale TaxID=63057 RepID=A0A2P5FQI1_TREOI|nr:hypothetical protein TorRG33x02_041830 [Trema orientale]